MAKISRHKWSILTLTFCLLVGWNYWAPFFFSNASFDLPGRPSLDFQSFYYYGKSWLTQANPYPMSGSRSTVFLYPPTFLPLFGVFALFDFSIASRLWIISSFSMFLIALLALALTLKVDRRCEYVSVAALLFLTSQPLFLLFQLGQSELLVASLAALSLVSERLKHPFPSAILLSVATLLKGPAFLLLIYFVIFHRDLLYLARFLVSTVIIVGGSLLIVPLGLYRDYVAIFMTGLSSFASNWIQPTIALGVFGGLALFAVFSYWVSSRKLGVDQAALQADAIFLLNVLVMLLLGSGFVIYSYVWIILPLALFLSSLLMKEVRIRYYLVIGFAACLLNSILSTSLVNYRVEFPLAAIGNLTLTIVLIAISIRPTIIRQRIQRR